MDPIILPYGDSEISVPFPGETSPEFADCTFPKALPYTTQSIEKALEQPEGCAGLSGIIPASGMIAVLVSDLTRGRTAAAVLVPVLEYLERHGAGPDRTTIYIASGMHRGQSAVEIEAQLGASVTGRYGIVQHDARDRSALVEAGTTSFGTLCLFNREVTEADLVVGVSAVSFHYFAGFGGGRKLILPGISGEDTIMANHRRSLKDDPAAGLSTGCGPGVLDGNPVHEDMLEGASLMPAPVFMICAVGGAEGEPAFISAGDLAVSHRIAASRLRDLYTLYPGRRHKVVIASAGGSPKDINLLQAHKAIRHASLAVEDGGLLLMAAACDEGVGSDSLEEDFSNGRDRVPARVSERYTLNSQASMSIHQITGRIEVSLFSRLPDGILENFGFGRWNIKEVPPGEALVISDAASFLPVI